MEAGVVGEDLLLRALSDQLNVPFAKGKDLEDISSEILALLPAQKAIENNAYRSVAPATESMSPCWTSAT